MQSAELRLIRETLSINGSRITSTRQPIKPKHVAKQIACTEPKQLTKPKPVTKQITNTETKQVTKLRKLTDEEIREIIKPSQTSYRGLDQMPDPEIVEMPDPEIIEIADPEIIEVTEPEIIEIADSEINQMANKEINQTPDTGQISIPGIEPTAIRSTEPTAIRSTEPTAIPNTERTQPPNPSRDTGLVSTHDIDRSDHESNQNSSANRDIESLTEFIDILESSHYEEKIKNELQATITFRSIGLSSNPSDNDIENLNETIVSQISSATCLDFINTRTERKEECIKYVEYMCKQDKRAYMELRDNFPPLELFDCNSKLSISYRRDYNFVIINYTHAKVHGLNSLSPVPSDLKEYIKVQNCFDVSELFRNLSTDSRFSRYCGWGSSVPKSQIVALYKKYVVTKWKKAGNPLESYHLLLESNELPHIKRLRLNDHLGGYSENDYVAIEFQYFDVDRKLFKSAAIDNAANLTSTFDYSVAVAVEHKGESYPIGALFCSRDKVFENIITDFLVELVSQGYSFDYMTCDLDPNKIRAVEEVCSRGNVQICLRAVQRAIKKVAKVTKEETIDTSPYPYLYRYEWFYRTKEYIDILNDLIQQDPTTEVIDKEIRNETSSIISSSAKDSLSFYAKRSHKRSNSDNSNIHVEFSKTKEELHGELTKKLFEYIVVEKRKLLYFQSICRDYLEESKFEMWSRITKPYIPRIKNTLVELFLNVLKRRYLHKSRSLDLDKLLFVMHVAIQCQYSAILSCTRKPFGLLVECARHSPQWRKKMLRDAKEMRAQSIDDDEHYHTDLELWVCSCGDQKENPVFLCKHLVNAAIDNMGKGMDAFLAYAANIRTTLPLLMNQYLKINLIESINGRQVDRKMFDVFNEQKYFPKQR